MTTHWPLREDESSDAAHSGVWVQDKKEHIIKRVSPGDLVFIYESQSGRTEVRTYVDGTVKRIPRLPGRGGIVALVQVTERASQPKGSKPEKYADGSSIWWRYYAPTISVNSAGFLSRREVNSIFGYSENNVLRGFGEEHSGLMEISGDLYDQLFSAFTASARKQEQARIANAPAHRFGGGGEGPQHLALKRLIASDPARVLGEVGLTLWAEEWAKLPTGDRIDLVLKDSLDRFVAVEVEVCCEVSELAGPLQCMKYRAMLSYFFRRPLEEVRCILVAHSIHRDVATRCGSHKIEIKEISLPS